MSLHDLAIQMNITSELGQTKAVFAWQRDTFITEVGEPLAASSARLAQALFERVVVRELKEGGMTSHRFANRLRRRRSDGLRSDRGTVFSDSRDYEGVTYTVSCAGFRFMGSRKLDERPLVSY